MPKTYNPTTPSLRQLVLPTFAELTRRGAFEGSKSKAKVKPTKSLLLPKKRTNGRNNHGHITCRHKGGGHKKHYRIIDFRRDKDDIPAVVASVEYDPNRTAFIALLNYRDGEKRYILAPKGLKKGDEIKSGESSLFKTGCCMALKSMPLGSFVHNIELQPGKGGYWSEVLVFQLSSLPAVVVMPL